MESYRVHSLPDESKVRSRLPDPKSFPGDPTRFLLSPVDLGLTPNEGRIAPGLQVPQPRSTGSVLGAGAIALACLLAAGGAAAEAGAVWIGFPGVAALAAAAAGLALGWALRSRVSFAVAAGLLAPLSLLLLGAPLAGVRALSGPPLAALGLAGLALAAATSRVRLGGPLFLPLVFAVLLGVAGRSHVQVGPEGDEPHYLMVADSLLRDGDLALEKDYAERRYASFHDGVLEPHYRVRGKGGEIYSLHAVGLSVLILPAWALAGYAGVTVFMTLISALVVREVREWIRELTDRDGLAEAGGWLAALSPPLVYYAGLVFTEVPAALCVSAGLRLSRREHLGTREAVLVGCAAAAMGWLNVRYAPLATVVIAHALWRHPRVRTIVGVLAPCTVSAAGLLLYHHALYGFWDPRRVYGRRPEFALATLPEGLPGLLLDQEFGLLVYAPVLVLALVGLVFLWRRDRGLGLAALAAIAAVVLTAATWHMWRGGFNPPARFLVPIVPLLWLGVALVFDKRGLTAGAALLVGWTLWTGFEGASQPRLVHRDRDGTAPLFRERSGAREWTGLLPAYVLSDPDRHRLAGVWALALLAAVPWRARPASARRLAVACLGLVVAARAAAVLSRSRAEDRDAVRLAGRSGVRVPGWRVGEAPARWTPHGLGWGPLYEPHRHPAGAELGRRLPLPPGSYRLAIAARDLAGSAPTLVVVPDRPGAVAREAPCASSAAGWEAPFAVRPGERAVTLLLKGGGPLLVTDLTLRVQPPGPGAV